MIHQYAFNTSEIIRKKDICDLFDMLSEERKDRIRKFYFEKDKVHSIFVEIILRYALWERYGLKDKDIIIQKTQYGKPYLANYKNIHFNLSHSGDWVLCGVGDSPIGIDVEQINDKDFSIAKKVFTKEESDYLFTQNENDKIRVFYNIWTLKESYIKNVGRGLSIPLKSFMFKFEGENIKIIIQGEENENYSFNMRKLDKRHYMALCVKGKLEYVINDNFTILSLEKLLKWKDMMLV